MAPDSDAASRVARDELAVAASRRRIDKFDLTRQQFNPIGFDHGVERESAPGFTLAPAAMAAVNGHRFCRHEVAYCAPGACAFEGEDCVGVHRGLSIGIYQDRKRKGDDQRKSNLSTG